MKKIVSLCIGLYALLVVALCAGSLIHLEDNTEGLQLTTLYGKTLITEPVLIALITSKPFERLKYIHQYGVMQYTSDGRPFSRYEHSLGVFFITRVFGAGVEEQIAALLHDVSHTVFSHVGDRLFKSNYRLKGISYQDSIHEWFISQTDLIDVLASYGYADACSEAKKKQQFCFEQALPDLCADRIEYNLSGAFLDSLINRDEVRHILMHLHFENDTWFFDTIEDARKFGDISLRLSEERWGSAWSAFIDDAAAKALERACSLGLITMHDIHFSTDATIWQILCMSNDEYIMQQLEHIKAYRNRSLLACPSAYTQHLYGKFSGTDPLVMTATGLHRLSAIDEEYQEAFQRIRQLITQGWYIQ